MSAAGSGRVTLLDLMILIAATAIGARSLHAIWGELNVSHFASPLDKRGPLLYALVRAPHAIQAAAPLAAAWTAAVTLLGMFRPRPPLRRLAIQPGMAACVVATVALGISAVSSIAGKAAYAFSAGEPFPLGLARAWQMLCLELIERPSGIGIAVAGVWSCLGLGRRWRARPTWIDRAGRGLGTMPVN